jgi:hypothetical protein
MRMPATLLAALAFACASAPVPTPTGRIALILDRHGDVIGRGCDALLLNVGGQIKAATVVTRDTPIDESAFDTVVIMGTAYSGMHEQSIEAMADKPMRNDLWPVSYQIRRGGVVTRSGSMTLVMPDGRGMAGAYLRGVQKLLRDVATP